MLVPTVEHKVYKYSFRSFNFYPSGRRTIHASRSICYILLATVIFKLGKVPRVFESLTLVQLVCLLEMRKKLRGQSEVSAFVRVHEVSPPSDLECRCHIQPWLDSLTQAVWGDLPDDH